MMDIDIDREHLEEYLEVRESQLNNVLSSPIGTGDSEQKKLQGKQ